MKFEVDVGTWANDAYGNDDALVWVDELVRAPNAKEFILTSLRQALSKNPGAIECRRAVAAAELVAKARGHGPRQIPEELSVWLAENNFATSEPAKLAIRMLRNVSKESELLELWDQERNKWIASCKRTIARLERPQKKQPSQKPNRLPKNTTQMTQAEAIKTIRKHNGFVYFENRKPDMAGMDSGYQMCEELFLAFGELKTLNQLAIMDASYECRKKGKPSWMKHVTSLPKLKHLCFEGNRITDDYLELIHLFPKLSKLEIQDANITDTSLELIAKCNRLRTVSIVRCNITKKKFEQLKRSMPDCFLVARQCFD